MGEKAIVLHSGGQDSTTCLYWAINKFGRENVSVVSMFYGQRHVAELTAADAIATDARVHRSEFDLAFLGQLADSALVDPAKDLTWEGGRPDAEMQQGLPSSFVPGRNLLFLASAAALAVKQGAKHIVTGVCQTDYSGYPDCRDEFVQAMNAAINLAMPSSAQVEIHTPLMFMTKAETVTMAAGMGDECWRALARSVTCYQGQRPGCGTCAACVLRAKGFADAGLSDPAQVVG